ncbi:MAG: hypothetical protein WAR79_13300 [Melioribacteraceae bacterium]
MFEDSNCNLVTKIVKEKEGISYEFKYYIQMNSDEKTKLKEFREEYAKTSPIHFNFDEQNFLFSQKKYFKKSQFISDSPILEEIELKFLNDIKQTLIHFNNLLKFEKMENLEISKQLNLSEILNTSD